jgi:hypothetical protein
MSRSRPPANPLPAVDTVIDRRSPVKERSLSATALTPRPSEEDVMKLRLHGTSAECAAATERLRRTSGLHIADESRPYPDRAGELVHVYLTVDLDPTSTDRPGQRAADGGGRRR